MIINSPVFFVICAEANGGTLCHAAVRNFFAFVFSSGILPFVIKGLTHTFAFGGEGRCQARIFTYKTHFSLNIDIPVTQSLHSPPPQQPLSSLPFQPSNFIQMDSFFNFVAPVATTPSQPSTDLEEVTGTPITWEKGNSSSTNCTIA
jgi:hypothetical protein